MRCTVTFMGSTLLKAGPSGKKKRVRNRGIDFGSLAQKGRSGQDKGNIPRGDVVKIPYIFLETKAGGWGGGGGGGGRVI